MKEYYLHPTKGMRPFVRRDRQKAQETELKQEEKEQNEWQQ